MRYTLSGPVLARTGWGQHFKRIHLARGHEHAQPLEAIAGGLGTAVVDADVTLEAGAAVGTQFTVYRERRTVWYAGNRDPVFGLQQLLVFGSLGCHADTLHKGCVALQFKTTPLV